MNAIPSLPTARVPLGRSDLSVSPVCLGTMTFGEQVNESDAHAILGRSLESGINFIDTAEMYAVPAKAETGHHRGIVSRHQPRGDCSRRGSAHAAEPI